MSHGCSVTLRLTRPFDLMYTCFMECDKQLDAAERKLSAFYEKRDKFLTKQMELYDEKHKIERRIIDAVHQLAWDRAMRENQEKFDKEAQRQAEARRMGVPYYPPAKPILEQEEVDALLEAVQNSPTYNEPWPENKKRDDGATFGEAEREGGSDILSQDEVEALLNATCGEDNRDFGWD